MAALKVVNGQVELACEVAGEGPAVVLLHGWPDSSALWRDVAPRLVDAGYRVVVPDLRGCGRSSKPAEVADYKMAHLVGDVLAIIDQVCGGRAHLVGHDLGSNLAWVTASYAPDAVERLAAVSVGHPSSFRSAGIAQQVRSWYVLLFEHQGIAEEWLSRDDFAVFRQWLGHPDAAGVVDNIVASGSLSTHLNWYRATITARIYVDPVPVLPAIHVPTLGIWSSGDLALTEVQMTGSAPYCDAGFAYERMEGLGHWIPLEDPEGLTGSLVAFFDQGPR